MRTSKIYSLCKFQVRSIVVNYSCLAARYSPRTCLITGSLYLSPPSPIFPPCTWRCSFLKGSSRGCEGFLSACHIPTWFDTEGTCPHTRRTAAQKAGSRYRFPPPEAVFLTCLSQGGEEAMGRDGLDSGLPASGRTRWAGRWRSAASCVPPSPGTLLPLVLVLSFLTVTTQRAWSWAPYWTTAFELSSPSAGSQEGEALAGRKARPGTTSAQMPSTERDLGPRTQREQSRRWGSTQGAVAKLYLLTNICPGTGVGVLECCD